MAVGDNTHVAGLPTLYLMSLFGSDREVPEGLAAEAALVNLFFIMSEQDDVLLFVHLKSLKSPNDY